MTILPASVVPVRILLAMVLAMWGMWTVASLAERVMYDLIIMAQGLRESLPACMPPVNK